jgi:plasmid stabilization system protein ParE
MRKAFAVEIGQRAEADLVHVAEWYAERHPTGTARFLRDFQKSIAILRAFPFAGREREELQPGTFSYAVHPYIVFYLVDEPRQKVIIVRVLHGSMDISDDQLS